VDTALPRAELNEPLVYQVRPGDTLSDLSGRFLGSTRRFLELYEANRDVLASPDDLKVGMLLTIPRQNREGGNRGTGGGTPRATEGDAPAPDAVVSDGRRDGSSPLFRPAARSPFAPRFDEDGRPIQ
jgi:hypothetical protein